MKKRLALWGAIGTLAVIAVAGGSMAALSASTEGKAGRGITEISTKAISVSKVGEVKDGATITDAALPGEQVSCRYRVKNDVDVKKNAYDIYARVRIYKSWENEALDSKNIKLTYEEQGKMTDYENEGYITENGWLVTQQDEEELELYYTKPLKKGEESTDFLEGVTFPESLSNQYTDQKVKLEFEVTAVQVDAGDAAIQAEWGVFPKIIQGDITGVYETKQERDAQ